MIERPNPMQVKAARTKAGLTQTAAAEVVHTKLRTWQSWEDSGDNGRPMPLAEWELFLIKTKLNKKDHFGAIK